MTVLLVVEHDHAAPRESVFAALTAAKALGDDITALVAGGDCRAVAETVATFDGVSRVRLAQSPILADGLAENVAPVIVGQAEGASHVVMASGAASREWLPRAAALADAQMITDIVAIESADTFVRPLYAGNALATVKSHDAVKWVSVRATAFAPATGGDASAAIEEVAVGEESALSAFVESRVSELTRPELTAAKIVVSGGRGMGSADNFQLIEKIADKLTAAVGASRAAVDAGYVPNDYQVGQTGKIVAPDLYLAVGISGAIQHIAGMKDSKCIVAINKDPDAPIFEIADYGLVADLFEALPELDKALG
jgi:electron transfer flavoprotein alpha subunit